MNRAGLIERKEAVRAEIARTRQELARAQQTPAGPRPARSARQIAELEARFEALMAEEHALRLQIDRSG